MKIKFLLPIFFLVQFVQDTHSKANISSQEVHLDWKHTESNITISNNGAYPITLRLELSDPKSVIKAFPHNLFIPKDSKDKIKFFIPKNCALQNTKITASMYIKNLTDRIDDKNADEQVETINIFAQ